MCFCYTNQYACFIQLRQDHWDQKIIAMSRIDFIVKESTLKSFPIKFNDRLAMIKHKDHTNFILVAE